MATFFDSLTPDSRDNLLRRLPACMEYKVYSVPNKQWGFHCHYTTHHFALILIDKGGQWKVLKGSSIRPWHNLQAIEKSSSKLLVRREDLRPQSQLPRRNGYFYAKNNFPLLRAKIALHSQVDDFAAKEYQNTLLPRIRRVRKNIHDRGKI